MAVIVRFALDFGFQPTYPVHLTGGVVVTGASSGIGRHAAVALHNLGYTVFAGVRKSENADELEKAHPGIVPILLDVTKEESIVAVGPTNIHVCLLCCGYNAHTPPN